MASRSYAWDLHRKQDTRVKNLEAVGDSLLHIGVSCISYRRQVLLKGSKKMEIAGRDRTVSRLVQPQCLTNLPVSVAAWDINCVSIVQRLLVLSLAVWISHLTYRDLEA
jgi:hypothetical protein